MPHPQHVEVPRLGSHWSQSFWPIPQPQQCGIQATSVTNTTAHGNAGSLTHWTRLGIRPTSSWILVEFVNHWMMGTWWIALCVRCEVGGLISFFHLRISSCSWIICWKHCSFSQWWVILAPLSKTCGRKLRVYFWTLLFCMSVLMSVAHHYEYTIAFQSVLKSGTVSFPTLLSLYQDYFG